MLNSSESGLSTGRHLSAEDQTFDSKTWAGFIFTCPFILGHLFQANFTRLVKD